MLATSLWNIEHNSSPNPSLSNSEFYRHALENGFNYLKQKFEDGADIELLVKTRAYYVDQVLQCLWRHHLKDNEQISLLAVGGFGRAELHPYSDIDLLILLSESASAQPPTGLTEFITQLWDIGLEIGQSVRTLEECRKQAAEDITIATNLLEVRLLCGDKSLFEHLQQLTNKNKAWDTALFFEKKKEEQRLRHSKYNNTANNLEPNLKESPGGLRDIQVINWVAQQHFDVVNLHGLNAKGFITDAEYKILEKSQRFLWRVRFGLHILAGRKQENLLIDHQRDLAEMLGYKKTHNRLAVEHFMKEYYLCARSVRQMNELLLQLFDENIIDASEPQQLAQINRRFQTRNGYLETRNSGIFAYYPYAMLELILLLQQNSDIKGVRADTIRQIHAHIYLIDDKFRADIKSQSLFMEIIRQPKGLTDEFRRMNSLGILGAYLPEFGHIVGQMQHDLFHAYTVDQHTLFLLANLRRFSCEEHKDEFPLCSKVFHQLPKPELLYISGLFHDIAKGRGGDHSKLGMVDAAEFCARHSLSQFDTDIITFLVRHHLTMSATAQKNDIQDPDVIKLFAEKVGSVDKLNYLYLLTVADIRATNNNLWNGWRDSLLKQLHQSTRQWFDDSIQLAKTIEEKSDKNRAKVKSHLLDDGWSSSEIERIWEYYDDQYFARYTFDEIIWQTVYRLKHPTSKTLINTRRYKQHNTLEVFIYTPDRPRIFAATTACLEQLQLDILDAKINETSDGLTLNTYIVNGVIDNAHEVVLALTHSLDNLPQLAPISSVITPRKMKLFETKPVVKFKTNNELNHTVLELKTHDRPGLISSIAQVFLRCDIQVINAKLTTLGDQVEDIFFISTSDNKPLQNEQKQQLENDLIEQL